MSTKLIQNRHTEAIRINIHPNTVFRILMAAGFLSILLACNLMQSPEMKFEVDDHLLGLHEKNPALKVNYHVPAGYSRLPESSFPEPYQNMPGQHGENIAIHTIYQDTTTGSFMILSQVNQEQWEQYHDFVDNTLASPLALEWNHVNATTFTYKKFNVQQWLLQDLEWVNFRLLFHKGTSFFQVDYLIPTLKYDQEIARVIESSIGSFQSN